MAIHRVFWAAAFGSVVLVPAGVSAQSFDYSHTGESVRNALQSISKLIDEPLSAGGSLQNEIVILRLKGIDKAAFKEKLAATLRAEWVQEPSGWRLVRTPAILKLLRSEHEARLAAQFEKDFAASRQLLAAVPAFNAEALAISVTNAIDNVRSSPQDRNHYDMIRKLRNQLPTTVIPLVAMLAMDPKELASVSKGDRKVYSSQPTAMQRRLPTSVHTKVVELLKQNSQLASLLEGKIDEEDEAAWMFDDLIEKNLRLEPRKTLVIVEPMGMPGSTRVEVRVVGVDGRYIYTSSKTLQHRDVASRTPTVAPPGPDPSDPPLGASETNKLINEYWAKVRAQSEELKRVEFPKAAADVIKDPIKNDPLGIQFGDYAVRLAERENKQLIAVVPDLVATVALLQTRSGPFNVASFKKATSAFPYYLSWKASDGWIQTTFDDFEDYQSIFVERTSLASLFQQLSDNRPLGLEWWGRLAAKDGQDPRESPIMTLAMWMSTSDGGSSEIESEWGNDWGSLGVLGSLSHSQKSHLAAGGSIAFNSLSPDQQKWIRRIVFVASPYIETYDPAKKKDAELEDEEADPLVDSIFSEVTEQLPNGIPAQSWLKVETEREDGYYVKIKYDDETITSYMTHEEIVWQIFEEESMSPTEKKEYEMKILTFLPGYQNRFTFRQFFAKDRCISWELSENGKTPGGNEVPFAQLPDAVRKKLRDAVDKLKKEEGEPPPQ